MPSVTCTKIVKEAGGRILVRFGKVEMEFANLGAMKAYVASILDREQLTALALRLMIDRQPTLNNPSVFEGRSVNVDFSVNNWGTVT